MALSILARPIYTVGDAAGLLGLSRYKVMAWLDGSESGGRTYEPVVRPSRTGDKTVTWGEFVELGYLREYRRKGVPLQRLRPVIDRLREEFNTPYPLATAKPYIGGKELVYRIQQESHIPYSLAIVVRSGQALMLTAETERFLQKVEFDPPDDGPVSRLFPAGKTSPVSIDPLVRFGRPVVQGVAVERLWELHDAGEEIREISSAYDMSTDLVRAAIAYQEQQRPFAA